MVITIPSVYAVTKYLASDVIYKDTTVENALNDLYSIYNSNLQISLLTDSGAYGYAHIGIKKISEKYKKFKVTDLKTSQSTSNCVLKAWSDEQQNNFLININQEYFVSSSTDGFNYSYIDAQSKTATRCDYTIMFYN